MNQDRFQYYRRLSVITAIFSTILMGISCWLISRITGNLDYGWFTFCLLAYIETTAMQFYAKIKLLNQNHD